MTTFVHKIVDTNGLHARNALEFARAATAYQCSVRIEQNGKVVDGKNVMALMSLGARCGSELICLLEGSDEKTAETALRALAYNIL